MPRFIYKAKKGPTEVVQGEINAEDEDSALGKISAMGLIPIKLQAATPGMQVPAEPTPVTKKVSTAKKEKPEKPSAPVKIDEAKIKIPLKDLNIFTRQFAILLKANVQLLKSFQVLQIQTSNVKFKEVLKKVQNALKEGSSLSEALQLFPRIFNNIYVSLIHSGEVSGTLDKVMLRLADFAERDAEVRSRVKSALVYPIILFFVGVGTIFVLITFVMPRLMVVFEDLGTELPEITQFMLRVSDFCQAYWMFMLGGVAVLVVYVRSIGMSKTQKRMFDALALKLPVFGKLVEKAEIAKFLRSLQLLYENGIPLFQAVDVSANTVSNLIIQEELKKVPALLEGGETLAASLETVPYISSFVTNMVSVGEESGQLDAAVGETASFFETETNQFVKMGTSILEPLMILGVGIIVGFIVIAMLLPIFDIQAMAS